MPYDLAGQASVSPFALQQSPLYGAALRLLGHDVTRLNLPSLPGGCSPGQQVQLLKRRWAGVPLTWAPRVPAHALPALRSLLPRTTLLLTTLEADLAPPRRAGAFLPLMTPQWIAEIDLTAPPDIQMSRQTVKWRNRLRRALDGPLSVDIRRFHPDRDHDLIAPELAQRKTRRYRGMPPGFLGAFAMAAPAQTRIALARHRGQVVAAMVFLLHPPGASYVLGWSNDQGRALHAHPRLLWEISAYAAKCGAERLDLGSLDTEHAPGLARFKLGSGAQPRALGPTLMGVPSLWRFSD